MAVPMPHSRPVAHWPLVLGGGRTRKVAPLLAPVCPPPPAPVLAGGRGVEARLLAMRDGPPALSKGGARVAERGLVSLLQPGLTRASLHAERLGPRRAALLAAHRTRVCGALARHALAVSAMAPPWLPPETTTRTRSGA